MGSNLDIIVAPPPRLRCAIAWRRASPFTLARSGQSAHKMDNLDHQRQVRNSSVKIGMRAIGGQATAPLSFCMRYCTRLALAANSGMPLGDYPTPAQLKLPHRFWKRRNPNHIS